MADGERKIEAFLTHLAVNGQVSPSTQNQTMNALLFLYRQGLKMPLEERMDVVRAERKVSSGQGVRLAVCRSGPNTGFGLGMGRFFTIKGSIPNAIEAKWHSEETALVARG